MFIKLWQIIHWTATAKCSAVCHKVFRSPKASEEYASVMQSQHVGPWHSLLDGMGIHDMTMCLLCQKSVQNWKPRDSALDVAPFKDRRFPCQILPLRGHKCGNTTVKIWSFAHKFAPQGRLVYTVFTKFSTFVRVYRYLSIQKSEKIHCVTKGLLQIYCWVQEYRILKIG